MSSRERVHISNLINVTGKLGGSINGVATNGTVTGSADRSTGHVTNVYHGIDRAIGPELSVMHQGLTIVCAHMAVEAGAAKNLNSMAPMQTLQRLVTFTLPSHSMQCLQTVAWTEPNVAVVTMEFSGTLPSCSGESLPIPDVLSEFRQTGPETIQQRATTQATFFDGDPQPLSVDIKYSIDGRIPGSISALQFLENANNTSSYDETTQKITYNTDVRMLESQ
ncbi:hypothetical protein LB561_12090 [Mesorhizobium sp. B292B1B]|uniref:hypothetical protein n=1 Tax=unclassified Mesorhizobium TaxID=325217 RepID=UPI00112CA1A5|nr:MULTISPECIES: hypothetical protein [unclassified Mesorhizobium]MBZ9965663.1 hypothetical protein [Mesorhizobium sp. BR1-1-2]MCA0011776.1 hypothetical protein [Mesorhizobium sp. B294B1A1]MCA0038031.1 hypothetical protein [Mesorhizobium sp. B292B1B]TPM42586.1 hypothetical protein FJ964_23000 [Mesorhizobium sp. B2-3-2]